MRQSGLSAIVFVLLVPGSVALAQGAPGNTDACALLTAEEVSAAAGWKPESVKPETYGTTATCTYTGAKPGPQTVVLVLARPAPKVTTSAAMAEWRTKQLARQPDLTAKVSPVEGLGVPAIRSDDEGAPPTVEAAVNGRLLGVTAATFDLAKALARKAVAAAKK